MRIDNKRICEHEDGCSNLARIDHVINHIVKRGKLCEKHHRNKHPRTYRYWRHKDNFNKCVICGWDGPCDQHRRIHQEKYNKGNVMSVCPNCHRLHNYGIKLIS